MDNVRTLSRTYAQATAGYITSMSFNSTTAAFKLSYSSSPSCKKPTEIFLNEQLHYPNGFHVVVSPAEAAWVHSATNQIQVTVQSTLQVDVIVEITAK